MWSMPVRWLLPRVGRESNTSSAPPHRTASSRSATGSQSRYRVYQPTASVAFDVVSCTWW